tara:strand:- start:5 stop:454 length:450 start_codon:yes stop_codon:yes gene_type:complete
MSNNEKDSIDDGYKKIDEASNKKLRLSLHELLFIDDHITLMIDGRDFEQMIPLRPAIPSSLLVTPIDFIDKIGRAFLQILRTGGEVTVNVSEMELYMLREICFTRVEYFGKHVGLSLKKKVLSALYSQQSAQDNLLEKLLRDIDLGENK